MSSLRFGSLHRSWCVLPQNRKSSRLVVEKRLDDVAELLAAFIPAARIERVLSAQYGVTTRQVRSYVSQAYARMAKEKMLHAPYRRERLILTAERNLSKLLTDKLLAEKLPPDKKYLLELRYMNFLSGLYGREAPHNAGGAEHITPESAAPKRRRRSEGQVAAVEQRADGVPIEQRSWNELRALAKTLGAPPEAKRTKASLIAWLAARQSAEDASENTTADDRGATAAGQPSTTGNCSCDPQDMTQPGYDAPQSEHAPTANPSKHAPKVDDEAVPGAEASTTCVEVDGAVDAELPCHATPIEQLGPQHADKRCIGPSRAHVDGEHDPGGEAAP